MSLVSYELIVHAPLIEQSNRSSRPARIGCVKQCHDTGRSRHELAPLDSIPAAHIIERRTHFGAHHLIISQFFDLGPEQLPQAGTPPDLSLALADAFPLVPQIQRLRFPSCREMSEQCERCDRCMSRSRPAGQ